jgi:hypothetical protein
MVRVHGVEVEVVGVARFGHSEDASRDEVALLLRAQRAQVITPSRPAPRGTTL